MNSFFFDFLFIDDASGTDRSVDSQRNAHEYARGSELQSGSRGTKDLEDLQVENRFRLVFPQVSHAAAPSPPEAASVSRLTSSRGVWSASNLMRGNKDLHVHACMDLGECVSPTEVEWSIYLICE